MTTNRVSFEQVAVAAGYFSMRWKSPFSMMYFEGCLQTGLFRRDLVLTLDSETRAAPAKKEVAANSLEIANGVYRPNSSVDWNRIFRGSWTITAMEQSDEWLSEFIENFTLPIIPTYSTLRYPPFPELLPVMQLCKSRILASLCSSRSLTVVGRGASFERLVRKVGDHMNERTSVELQALAINDYSVVALECAGKFSRQLYISLGLPIAELPQAEESVEKLSLSHIENNARSLFKNNPGFPARPIDLRTIRERYGDHPVLKAVALHTGAEWLIDEANVAQLRFFTSPEIVDETQELMDMREDLDVNCPEIDNQTTLAIAQFHESGDRICVLLSGPKSGTVAILSLDSDDAIIAESFKEFIAMLDVDAVSLLRKFGVADVAFEGKMVRPYDV